MALDPLAVTRSLREDYLRYLTTTFHLRDAEFRRQFTEALQEADYVRGPYLEATPPFEKGDSLRKMIEKGVLAPGFSNISQEELPLERPFYLHQEQAIRKLVQQQRNVVVATGTGSGKTEAFLVPIINHLLKQRESGDLSPGVRALLLYPMNALANDQLKRFRKLFESCPDITFGRYTGETEETRKKALSIFREMYQEEPLENELISRQEMRKSPPHMLLTNYAMLEYLLLRPKDNPFFDGPHSENWKYIVLDEAHTYSGAKGIEMAMLLRRLKDRVVASEVGKLRCIATSATLGRGKQDFPAIAAFAQNLFGETFEWHENNRHRQDVVGATRLPMGKVDAQPWGCGKDVLYRRMQEVIQSEDSDSGKIKELSDIAISGGIPSAVVRSAEDKAGDNTPVFLYHCLKGDSNVALVRRLLAEEPQSLSELVERLFPESDKPAESVVALVDLSARATGRQADQSLLPARYHLFVRAIEGAYASLEPRPEVFVQRREFRSGGAQRYPVFEMATCRQCGGLYLVGETHMEGDVHYLRQPGKAYFEDPGRLGYYLLLTKENLSSAPENEDEMVTYGEEIEVVEETYLLCGRCGAIRSKRSTAEPCECGTEYYRKVVKVDSKAGRVHRCPACAKWSSGSMVWRFLTGRDAVASVLTTTLYQQLPNREIEVHITDQVDAEEDDPWAIDASSDEVAVAQEPQYVDKNSLRKLLIFSDSRRDAAFFATYVNHSYSRFLRRRLIVQVLADNSDAIAAGRWTTEDLVTRLARRVDDLALMPEARSQRIKDEAWKWVLYELVQVDRRNSLEQMGILGFSMTKPKGWMPPKALLMEPWDFTEEEVWTLYQILLQTLRKNHALTFPEGVDPRDRFFEPVNYAGGFRDKDAVAKRHVYSWVPREGYSNTRLNFLQRLAESRDINIDDNHLREVLIKLWKARLTSPLWKSHFKTKHVRNEGYVHCLDHRVWRISSGLFEGMHWYQCDRCKETTPFNLGEVCPRYRCDGSLQDCDVSLQFEDNHYWCLYTGLDPLKMRAEEHTAQLSSQAAAELQAEFEKGHVNVLSCSTTFELGVDVGDLESVFMRNVPPTPANYCQRAGRAGRKSESTAFSLTYCLRRPHDLAHFESPKELVAGSIMPPHFELKNEKVVRRHIHAVALAEFWRRNPNMFGRVAHLFSGEPFEGVERIDRFLEAQPTDVKNALQRIVPNELQDRFGISDWQWTKSVTDLLLTASSEVRNDIKQLQEAREERVSSNKSADSLTYSINTIRLRPIIDFLSTRNVLPKYGFPVDVVELQFFTASRLTSRLELNRDLRIALSEYAPSSEVVAGGYLWTSRYLKKLPEREWPRFTYAICQHCGHYQRARAEVDWTLNNCEACQEPLRGPTGDFVIPEFGFMVDRNSPQKPGQTQPERTYTTRTYYAQSGDESTQHELTIRGSRHMIRSKALENGKLAVLNQAGGRGFFVCDKCGYAVLAGEDFSEHKTPWGNTCNGSLTHVDLGHEFNTDVLLVQFVDHSSNNIGHWQSLLYALLEGTSKALDIDRGDLDGCLYPLSGDPDRPALVLFDDVPGGAGHVRKAAENEDTFLRVVLSALEMLESCECGGEEANTSCYGCLRNYRNQFCHDQLSRGEAITVLEGVL